MLDFIKYDCKNFKGAFPCKPNKNNDFTCNNCNEYIPIDKKILIIKLGAIGDVIRTTPLIQKFKELYPNCQISWLTQFTSVLPKQIIDKIFNYDFISFFTLSNTKFDIAINLDKEEEVCMLLANVEAEEKYGFIWKDNHIAPATQAAEHKLLTGFFDNYSKQNKKHYVEEIFEICHLTFNDEKYLLNINEELVQKWTEIFKSKSCGKTIVGLNTGCGNRWSTRLWNEKYWIELIKLLQQNNYFPIVLGGEQENSKNIFLSKQTNCYYPGTFSLEEFFSIASACDIIVTQVSMMLNIAVALQKKIVLMNNIFNINEFYLYNRGIIVEPSTGCDCYFGNTCKRKIPCMNDIKPETVFKAVLKL
ncbi:MAG: hypothetical protein LBV69_08145 [Bacteroidales bacterium]|jgi:heptosyltransferase-2|nr:hypothetical protein [Bacteroidales bacterium]